MTTTTHSHSTVIPGLRYHDAPSAIEWLCNVLGFEKRVVYPGPEGTIAHAELTLGGGMVMLGSAKDDDYGRRFKLPRELGFETRSVYIVVPDADAAYARAEAAGAIVMKPVTGHPLRQPRLHGEGPRRPHLDARNLRSLGRAGLSTCASGPGTSRFLSCRTLTELPSTF